MNESILITGAGGFIGSHLAEACVREGLRVRAFVHYNSSNRWGWLESSKYVKDMEIVVGDIRDYDSVKAAVEGCQTVYHLAALIGIPYSYVSPMAYVKTNIEGTYNVLQASRELGVAGILTTSTSETYGTAQYVPIDEKHPVVAQSPYAASKIGADQLAFSYYRSFGLPVKVVRPFNTFGPRQSARAIIPTIVTQIMNQHKEIMVGNLRPTRDFTFVHDTIQGFLEIARSKSLYGEATNIGMKSEISIGHLIRLIASIMQVEVTAIMENQRVRPEESEVERLVCDNTKIMESTNWTPKFDLREGLVETIEWFRENLGRYKAEIYNV